MRVLHAVRSDGFAGVERHVARLARAQSAHGDGVVVVGGDPAGMRATTGDAPVRLLPAASTTDVLRALLSHGPGADVVHVHMTAAEVAASVATVLRPRVGPVVSTRHFARPRGTGRFGPAVAAVARRPVVAQVAISRFVADSVDGPSVVVPPGVEDRGPAPRAAERERVALLAQRLEPEKGTDVALRAFAASGLADAGWHLDVAGDGALRTELEALAAGLGIGTAVRFLGRRGDVDALMARAALLLAPCAVEGLGLSVLEAMSSGLPVVAARAGGHVELLDGLDDAALHDPTDPAAAAAALAALAAAPDRRDALADAARRRQVDRYTPDAWVAGTAAVYRRALEAR
ncbi:glycosyltransferase family 4 protein [Cellulosimicrobium marinum]|uniref:glycosyltransferase family 4 protein n=1 Tax=Cellulosimicrobium marinum TaxID=1638992 RepID=UPI001E60AFDD|nr:glycosyltransferase family 4 protein [Cellulosimicrobium marinum]MCB7137027.1 glycosyltransferase family 4 protein [Cellulosimicrobium marinum]